MATRFESRRNFLESKDAPSERLARGLWRQRLLSGDRLSICLTRFESDGALVEATHAYETVGYVVSGEVEVTIGSCRQNAGPGCSYLVRSNESHSVRTQGEALVLNGYSSRVPPPLSVVRDADRSEAFRPSVGQRETRGSFVSAADVPPIEMLPGFLRQTLAHGDELMLVLCTLKQGGPLPEHNHPHEQASFVIAGALELDVAGQTRLMRGGCSAFMYSNQFHSAHAIEATVSIDIFSPPRNDYLPNQ